MGRCSCSSRKRNARVLEREVKWDDVSKLGECSCCSCSGVSWWIFVRHSIVQGRTWLLMLQRHIGLGIMHGDFKPSLWRTGKALEKSCVNKHVQHAVVWNLVLPGKRATQLLLDDWNKSCLWTFQNRPCRRIRRHTSFWQSMLPRDAQICAQKVS